MHHINWSRLMVLILIMLLVGLWQVFGAVSIPEPFFKAIWMVETGGNLHPPRGDDGRSRGPFQISYAYWLDSGVKGTYSQCDNYDYAKQVVSAYLRRYVGQAVKSNNYEIMARVHNGGPKGYLRASTLQYWKKVQKFLDKS